MINTDEVHPLFLLSVIVSFVCLIAVIYRFFLRLFFKFKEPVGFHTSQHINYNVLSSVVYFLPVFPDFEAFYRDNISLRTYDGLLSPATLTE